MVMFPLVIIAASVVLSALSFLVIAVYFSIKVTLQKLEKVKAVEKGGDDRFSVGILHPFAAYGNPEERVLWAIVTAIQNRYPQVRIVVYTGDIDTPPEKILSLARLRLHQAPLAVEFIYLTRRRWIEAGSYPRFPRLGINLGAIPVAIEALSKFVPDLYLDTVGLPLTFPIFKYFGGCSVAAYLTSAPDVLYAFSNRRNYSPLARNKYVSFIQKITYSKAYRFCSGWAAQAADIVIANSTWTEKVVTTLWDGSQVNLCHVYPPCPVEALRERIKRDDDASAQNDFSILQICSLAQFTPQADHPLQIRSLFQLRQLLREDEWDRVQLVFLATCNTSQELDRVQDMQDLSKHLSLEHNVSFKLNLPYEDVMAELGKSLMAIHTMALDPFSIGVVECMAAGVLTVAHNSGGTSKDITVDFSGCRTAFLATDELEYAEALKHIIQMPTERRAIIRSQAQRTVERFCEGQFRKHFLEAVEFLFK